MKLNNIGLECAPQDRKARMFRLQPMPVRDGLSFVGVLEMFNHQSHYPFWSFRPSEELVPLPALLLTDTGLCGL